MAGNVVRGASGGQTEGLSYGKGAEGGVLGLNMAQVPQCCTWRPNLNEGLDTSSGGSFSEDPFPHCSWEG